MKYTIRIATAAALLSATACASAADVTVKVDGVKDSHGQVHIMLFDSATWLRQPLRDEGVPAKQGTTEVALKNVPPGEYVFAVYHDINGNGHLDVDAQGTPTEPFAVSNEPAMESGPPSFENAKFVQSDKGTTASVKLITLY